MTWEDFKLDRQRLCQITVNSCRQGRRLISPIADETGTYAARCQRICILAAVIITCLSDEVR
jgi:hypothetical protein